MRAIRYFVKFPRKYRGQCLCGCEFVGYSKRARKALKKRRGKGVMFKVQP